MQLVFKYFSGDECDSVEAVYVNGAHFISQMELTDCPEDAVFGRRLMSPYDMESVIKAAYAAGVAGDELSIEYEEVTDIDDI